jgi:hypothetical protein
MFFQERLIGRRTGKGTTIVRGSWSIARGLSRTQGGVCRKMRISSASLRSRVQSAAATTCHTSSRGQISSWSYAPWVKTLPVSHLASSTLQTEAPRPRSRGVHGCILRRPDLRCPLVRRSHVCFTVAATYRARLACLFVRFRCESACQPSRFRRTTRRGLGILPSLLLLEMPAW